MRQQKLYTLCNILQGRLTVIVHQNHSTDVIPPFRQNPELQSTQAQPFAYEKNLYTARLSTWNAAH